MKSRINLQELLDSFDIEFYLDREGIEYRHTTGTHGPQLNVKECPVCGNDKWKVYLNAETGLGNCFSGSHPPDKKFNKFSFVKACMSDAPGPKVVEVIQAIAREVGWKPTRKSVEVRNENRLVIPTSYPIPINGKNLQYLENRNISSEVAAYFKLRYCHTGYFAYKVRGDYMFQIYDRRVIIPIFDLTGNLISFQGRDITGEAEKRYLFPPGFSTTSSVLYNGHNVRKTSRIVIGEGVFDVMALKIALDEDVALRDVVPIGTFGKHLSNGSEDDQLAKLLFLKENFGIKEVTFMWDGEKEAIKDAVNAGLIVKGAGFDVRVAVLPSGKDPNEVSTAEARKTYYEAVPLTSASAVNLLMMASKM